MTDKIRGALSNLEEISQPRSRTIPAVMGLGTGVVEVASNPYMVWVRLYGDQNQPARAWCPDMARVDDLPVKVAHTTDRSGGQTAYEVVGFGSNEIISNRSSGVPVIFDPYLPQHAASHEWSAINYGRDVVNVFPRALTPGRVYPTSPASMSCLVAALEYFYGLQLQYFQGGPTIDFTSEVPAENTAKLAFVCVDGATNKLAYQYGETFPWAGTFASIPPAARTAILRGNVLLSSIILYYGMTAINEQEFRYEMRPIFHAVSPPTFTEWVVDNYGDILVDNDGNVIYIDHSDDS